MNPDPYTMAESQRGSHPHRVALPWEPAGPASDWCGEHLQDGTWDCNWIVEYDQPMAYVFTFLHEADSVRFKLTWL